MKSSINTNLVIDNLVRDNFHREQVFLSTIFNKVIIIKQRPIKHSLLDGRMFMNPILYYQNQLRATLRTLLCEQFTDVHLFKQRR